MELIDFIEKFATQFDETDVSVFTAEMEFKNLDEWSSLSVIAMVDEEYDVTLKGDDVRNADTIEDLFNVVKNKL